MNITEKKIPEEHDYGEFFNGVIETTLKSALKIAASDPKLAVAGGKILYYQKKAAKIRQEHNLLVETNGGCTLWANREWVEGILKKGDLNECSI